MMKGEIKIKALIIAPALPLAAGGLAAFLTSEGMRLFALIPKPPLSPPGWLFAPVWTVLYILMGAASYLVWVSDASAVRKERALTLYAMQLAANFVWPLVFFGMGLFLPAFLWLILLWILAALTTLLFRFISEKAGKLMLPYMLWLSFAAYLNFGVWLLNR